MKKMFLGICYLLISHGLSAQQIAGQVTDESTGSPVASATVELSNIATLTTNEAGRFVFSKVKQGHYTLRITSIGYQAVETTVSPDNAERAIKLTRLNLFMQPVEVRAIRAGEKAPFAKTDLSKKDIEKLNTGQDLPFLLNQTPSVVVSSDAGNGVGYTGIRIRGTDGARINVTLNGIPYNDAESQGSFFVDLPDFTSSVNNIQVQRGVGTSSNGAGAFGATINLSTNEANTTAYGEINNSYGSFNTWKHTVKAGSGLINDHFTIDARLSKIGSDGFVDRGSSDLRSFYLSGAYLGAKTSVRFNIISGKEKTYQSWNGVPEAKLSNNKDALLQHYYNNLGTLYRTQQDSINLFSSDPRKYNYFTYANQTDNYQQDHYQLFLNHQFSSRLTANAAFFLSKGKGYYEEYKPGEAYADYGLPDFEAGGNTYTSTDLIRRLWLDNDYYGVVYSLQYKGVTDQFTVGGGWNRYDGHHFGEIIWAQAGIPNNYRWYNLEAYKTDVSAYAKYQYKLSTNWEVFADLQYRRVLYNIGGFRKNPTLMVRNTFDFFNPKAGITYTDGSFMAYLSYAQGNKEPNRDDFEAGLTQQPKPEKLHDFEAGVSEKGSWYEVSGNLYYMLYKNQLVQTGKINDVGGYTRTNVKDSYRMGVELQAGVRATQWLRVAANLTLSKNQIKDFTEFYDDYDNGGQKATPHGNTDIAFSPSIIAGGTVSLIPAKDLEISLPAKYVGRQYLDNTSNKQRSLGDYYVQDARVIYTLRNLLPKEISLIGQVNNVFNRRYNSNGYTYSYQYSTLITENFYFPMAGTNFMIALNVKL
ncbi:TonB-dependent receptor [Pseudoflavitalea sp. X16]|uniref:TonB-dependent receptor n=1 Tax=Paraflavitalea devenefica TaxID=2716334 RepID=UPI00141E0881|nr:TonB-dependent receptor [Paraflavitalea devenefica]NII25022.1 TonB-dependent receptor [Paraflavitalea devenefica]